MRKFGVAAGAAASFLLSAISADASPVTYDISFTSGSFISGNPPAGVIPPVSVSGDFTLTIDTSQTYTDETAGITLNTLGVSVDSAASFSYPVSFSTFTDVLIIGGLNVGAGFVQSSTNDFYLQIENFSTAPTYLQFGYTIADPAEDYFYTNQGDGSVTVTPVIETTPLPAGLPLFASGLGAIGLLARKRKRKAQPAP